MTTTFQQLIASTTEVAVRALVQTAGELVGLDFEAMPGNSVFRAIARSVVPKVIYDTFAGPVAEIAKGGFLDFASDGPWLEALGEQFYDTERIRQTFATTTARFTNAGANVYSFTEGQVIVQNPTTKRTYRAAAFTLFEAGDAQNRHVADVSITAIEPGSGSSADANTITTMVTVFDGVSVTNPSATSGTDLETASAYIARCRLAASATSPAGAADAYEYVALSALREDGSAIGVTRVSVDADNTTGQVTVYVADADGEVASEDVDVIEELLLQQVVPHGVDFVSGGVVSATAVSVPVTYTAVALTSAGMDEATIKDAVETALSDLMGATPIGGWNGFLRAVKIRGTIIQVEGLAGRPRPLVDVTLTLPAGDVALAADEVPVLGAVNGGTYTFLDD